jgi:putative methyltransferase (TIGR01177 family)
MSTPRYLYLTTLPNQDAELIHAECRALTGHAPNSYGIAISERQVDVKRGAYVKSCMEVLFEGGSVSEICAHIQSAELYAADFRVSVVRLPRHLKVDTMKIAHTVGGAIGGKARLTQPKVVFPLVVTTERSWLGRLLSESDGRWVTHQKRPYTTSSALPTRLARAVVNLVTSPNDRLVDPCCGTGTIVLEAAHIGVEVVGYDINPNMVSATRANLTHYGLNAPIHLGDARQITGRFDALATDLPYGIMLTGDASQDWEILRNARRMAPKAAFIAIRDLSEQLVDLGYRIRQVIQVPKHSIVRRVFVTASE